MDPLHRTTSFLAAAFYPQAEYLPYFIVTALVVSLAQAASLFLVVKAYQASTRISLVLVVVLFLMATLYFMFWKAQKDQARATRAVGVLWVLVALWYFLFELLVPKLPYK